MDRDWEEIQFGKAVARKNLIGEPSSSSSGITFTHKAVSKVVPIKSGGNGRTHYEDKKITAPGPETKGT